MKTVVRWGLKIISLVTFGLSVLGAWMFYVFYLKWVWVFEDGGTLIRWKKWSTTIRVLSGE